MTQKEADKISENGTDQAQRSDPEVLSKAKRRNFTASYKQWVLEEADKCRQQPGQIGALLRRKGLYSSHLTTWQRQREAGQIAGLKPRKRGRKLDEERAEINQLRHENKRITRQLEQAELIIEAQKKLSGLGYHPGTTEGRREMRATVLVPIPFK